MSDYAIKALYSNISDNSGKEEGRMRRQTSVPNIKPGPSD